MLYIKIPTEKECQSTIWGYTGGVVIIDDNACAGFWCQLEAIGVEYTQQIFDQLRGAPRKHHSVEYPFARSYGPYVTIEDFIVDHPELFI